VPYSLKTVKTTKRIKEITISVPALPYHLNLTIDFSVESTKLLRRNPDA
jgi:hypothetical protein